MIAAIAITAALLLSLVLMVTPFWLRSRARHLVAVSQHLEQLTLDGSALIRDIDVSDLISDLVAYLMEHARDPRISRALLWEFVSGRAYTNQVETAIIASLRRALRRMTPEQEALFSRFTGHVLLCSASDDPIFSIFSRRLLLWGLTPSLRGGAREGARYISQEVSGDSSLAVEVAAAIPGASRAMERRPSVTRRRHQSGRTHGQRLHAWVTRRTGDPRRA
jgi:hypothetical protein